MTQPSLPAVPQPPPGTQALGVGVDLVHVPSLADQLASPGTSFQERAFTPRERRNARRRAAQRGADPGGEAQHLAARWAAKEAFVKAWSQALALRAGRRGGSPEPVMPAEQLDWRQVEVTSDRWGRPSLTLTGEVARAVEASLGAGRSAPGCWPVSLSHDGDYAMAVVLASGWLTASDQAPRPAEPH